MDVTETYTMTVPEESFSERQARLNFRQRLVASGGHDAIRFIKERGFKWMVAAGPSGQLETRAEFRMRIVQ